MKYIVLLVALLAISNAIYTSSYWQKKGINVKDHTNVYPQALNASTTCSPVNLNVDPYFYNGVVRTGYLSVNKSNSVLSFMFYGRENTVQSELSKYPIVFWLNGGPGSSSQFGNLFELGAFQLKTANMKPYQIVRNNDSWTKDYHIVYVDQPVGTGLSYADQTYGTNKSDVYCKSMECVANDFYFALNELYNNPSGCFSLLGIKADHPFVIFGESYGGKYAPAIGQKILREQQDNAGFLKGLKGVAIGDGFTHPGAILSQVGQFAYNMGLLDYQQRSTIEQMILNGTFQERRQLWNDLHDTFDNVLDLIVEMAGGVNVYDITKYRPYPDMLISEYLGNWDIQTLYNLRRDIVFGGQSGNVYKYMYEDFMKPYVHLVQEVLRRKCKVMVYNGQNDLIVETPGTFKWAERVHYDNAEQFRNTLFHTWHVNGKVAGYRKVAGLYELRTVNNAGHLIPMDQGPAARHMLNDFVNRSLTVIEQKKPEPQVQEERIVLESNIRIPVMQGNDQIVSN